MCIFYEKQALEGLHELNFFITVSVLLYSVMQAITMYNSFLVHVSPNQMHYDTLTACVGGLLCR